MRSRRIFSILWFFWFIQHFWNHGKRRSKKLCNSCKLFNMRCSDNAAMTWELQHKSLSAFDVHPISRVFAAYLVIFYCFLKLCEREWLLNFFAYTPNSSSAINHAFWRSQRVVVRSLSYTEPPLSTTNIPTFPFRGAPFPFIPRHTSLGFHHTKMLCALSGPDGTGKSTFLLAFGGFLDYSTILLYYCQWFLMCFSKNWQTLRRLCSVQLTSTDTNLRRVQPAAKKAKLAVWSIFLW